MVTEDEYTEHHLTFPFWLGINCKVLFLFMGFQFSLLETPCASPNGRSLP